jgi:hypothetical protein
MNILARLAGLRALQPMRFRQYRLMWFGQIFGSTGTWMDV